MDGGGPSPVQMWTGVGPVPVQMQTGVGPVPVQMWTGVGPVPVQMWTGVGPASGDGRALVKMPKSATAAEMPSRFVHWRHCAEPCHYTHGNRGEANRGTLPSRTMTPVLPHLRALCTRVACGVRFA